MSRGYDQWSTLKCCLDCQLLGLSPRVICRTTRLRKVPGWMVLGQRDSWLAGAEGLHRNFWEFLWPVCFMCSHISMGLVPGKIGNDGFSYETWGFPVNFPPNPLNIFRGSPTTPGCQFNVNGHLEGVEFPKMWGLSLFVREFRLK